MLLHTAISTSARIARDTETIATGGATIPMTIPMMTKCGYPDCEKCDNFDGEHCLVPAVITKRLIFAMSERIALMDKTLTELENTVYDEILGADKA